MLAAFTASAFSMHRHLPDLDLFTGFSLLHAHGRGVQWTRNASENAADSSHCTDRLPLLGSQGLKAGSLLLLPLMLGMLQNLGVFCAHDDA